MAAEVAMEDALLGNSGVEGDRPIVKSAGDASDEAPVGSEAFLLELVLMFWRSGCAASIIEWN